LLDFSRAELKAHDVSTTALVFRELEHPPSDTPSSRRRINVHPPQFHCASGGAFEAEYANHFVARDRDPKTAIPLAVIRRYTIDFFRQRVLDIHLKVVTEVGRAEKPVDGDEQGSHLSRILIGKWADDYLCVHNLIPADELRVFWESLRSEPSHEGRTGPAATD
jgi:hypothetical protein